MIPPAPPGAVDLGTAEFEALRRLIHELTGIHLVDSKRTLVAGRLLRRLRALGLDGFPAYLAHLAEDQSGEERRELVNAITTNKTSFFREAHHFDYLSRSVVPRLVERARATGTRRVRVWSAGCSTGKEPWTIAMVLRQALGSFAGWDVRILASDLDTNVLAHAAEATYDAADLAEVPLALRASAFEHAGEGLVRIVDALRDVVTFRRINLVEQPWPVHTRFDVVFCRNVAIYFDRPTQESLFLRLASTLEPGGALISGHSENLHWLSHVLRPLGNTVYELAGDSDRTSRRSSLRPPRRPSRRPSARPAAMGDSFCPPGIPVQRVAIEAGGIHASGGSTVVRTTLGSCVAVCLFDPGASIGGMNHFMLPDGSCEHRFPATFGIHAMELLINAMMKLGADRRRLCAKVFGASSLLPGGGEGTRVAERNASFALEYLEAEGIPVKARKLLGSEPLVVYFHTMTGRARVRAIPDVAGVRTAEERRLAALAEARAHTTDDVTFFGRSP